jgi:hypoxanthine-guanine phosphoribosyltransferase
VDHQREDYAPPVIVVLLNGGVPAATRVLELVAGYGHHYDPIFINPSGYGASQVVGDIEIAKGLTAAERVRISGRRVIVFDDVHDTGKTSYETTKYLHDSTQGIVEYLGADYELFPPESIQYAFLFDKKPDPSALVGLEEYSGEPDFIGAEAPRSWITGFGCDTNIPDCYVGEPPQLVCGESVGRYALGGWIALQQPE